MWEFKIFLIICFLLIPGIIITADTSSIGTNSADTNSVGTNSVGTTTVDTIPIGIDAYPADTFVSVWDTTAFGSINLPLIQVASYDFQIDWGDGTTETITSDVAHHTYSTIGEYEIQIEGTFGGWYFYHSDNRLKLLEIKQWGAIGFGKYGSQFNGAENLQITATDAPNLSNVSDLSYAFAYCHNLGTTGNFNSWDVSSATNVRHMFEGASSFNQPLNNWNVSSVNNMYRMFYKASSFNQPLNSWDVSSVTDMAEMFYGTSSFNQPLSSWNTSSVTNMFGMFWGASVFNQPLNSWDVSSVSDMFAMFSVLNFFNQPLDNWNTSSVNDMSWMFEKAYSFNQDLSSWDISSVTDMRYMFYKVKLSTQNYDRLLNSWANQNVQPDIVFNGGLSQYSSAAADARQSLIDDFS